MNDKDDVFYPDCYLKRLQDCKKDAKTSNCKNCGTEDQRLTCYTCRVSGKSGGNVCICFECYSSWAKIDALNHLRA